METIFDRASRLATWRQRGARRGASPRYENVIVNSGGGASARAIAEADLVIDKRGDVGVVLKDRHGRHRRVTAEQPCPCQGGRTFGACHGR